MRKMKDSGVAWLGEIPEDWTVVFNKHLMKKVHQRKIYRRRCFIAYNEGRPYTGFG